MNTKILLIDDDEDEYWIFKEALKEIDDSSECFYAITANQGLKFLNQGLPDFVFVDVNMPFVNGLEFLDLIQKDDRLKEIPVVLYSTGIDNTIVYAAMNKGAFACIKKQNTIKDLVKKLKTLFAEISLQRVVNYVSLGRVFINGG